MTIVLIAGFGTLAACIVISIAYDVFEAIWG